MVAGRTSPDSGTQRNLPRHGRPGFMGWKKDILKMVPRSVQTVSTIRTANHPGAVLLEDRNPLTRLSVAAAGIPWLP